jgi:hypothetical protein
MSNIFERLKAAGTGASKKLGFLTPNSTTKSCAVRAPCLARHDLVIDSPGEGSLTIEFFPSNRCLFQAGALVRLEVFDLRHGCAPSPCA